jgi:MFS family permease
MGWSALPWIFTPCMVVYSLAYGGLASLQEPIRADYFGTKAFATIQGVSRTVQTVGTFLGPLIAGFVYDITKSYFIAFAIFAAVSIVSMILMFLARPPQSAAASHGYVPLRTADISVRGSQVSPRDERDSR